MFTDPNQDELIRANTVDALKVVFDGFLHELQKLVEKLDAPKWHAYGLEFHVTHSREETKTFVKLYNPRGEDIKAADLGRLMSEAARRFDFIDREQAAIDMQVITHRRDENEEVH